MSQTNQAVYLDGKAARLRVGEAPYPEPGPDEVVIRTAAVAINPVDWKIQDYGFMIQNWPAVLGEDVAGEIVAIGSNVTNLRAGDRVAHHSVYLAKQDNAHGGFQRYVRAPATSTARLPSNISYAQGSVLPLAIGTAVGGLYASRADGGMGLPLPSIASPPTTTQKTLLVWGGSSSVGAVTIQLARQSGARVVATASARNLNFVREAGAAAAFDYNDASVVEQVLKDIAAHGGEQAFLGVYDAISMPASYQPIVKILKGLGSNVQTNLATTLPPPSAEDLPAHVKVAHVFGVNDLSHSLWKNYVTPALEQGLLKPLPAPDVVGKGLESVQEALDIQKKGVSAKKIVVEL